MACRQLKPTLNSTKGFRNQFRKYTTPLSREKTRVFAETGGTPTFCLGALPP
jgi:hypothetical protein